MLSPTRYSSGPTMFLDGKHESQTGGSIAMHYLAAITFFVLSTLLFAHSYLEIVDFLIQTDQLVRCISNYFEKPFLVLYTQQYLKHRVLKDYFDIQYGLSAFWLAINSEKSQNGCSASVSSLYFVHK